MFVVIIALCIPFGFLALFLGKLSDADQLCHVKLLVLGRRLWPREYGEKQTVGPRRLAGKVTGAQVFPNTEMIMLWVCKIWLRSARMLEVFLCRVSQDQNSSESQARDQVDLDHLTETSLIDRSSDDPQRYEQCRLCAQVGEACHIDMAFQIGARCIKS